MAKTLLFTVLGGLAYMAVIGAVLFGCAGRWDLPFFWAYLGLWTASVLVGPPLLDPTLARERLRPGPGGKDHVTAILITPLWLGQHAVAGLDVGRFHWSDSVPLAVQVIGLLTMAGGLAVVIWAMVVNPFFSSVIRIQTERGHHLITSGPYRFIRHPAYACWPLLSVGGGLALGSWLAAALGVLLILPVLRRAVQEDRILRDQLQGYADYAEKVRYRMVPGAW